MLYINMSEKVQVLILPKKPCNIPYYAVCNSLLTNIAAVSFLRKKQHEEKRCIGELCGAHYKSSRFSLHKWNVYASVYSQVFKSLLLFMSVARHSSDRQKYKWQSQNRRLQYTVALLIIYTDTLCACIVNCVRWFFSSLHLRKAYILMTFCA